MEQITDHNNADFDPIPVEYYVLLESSCLQDPARRMGANLYDLDRFLDFHFVRFSWIFILDQILDPEIFWHRDFCWISPEF